MNHYVKRIPPDASSLHDVHSLYPVASEQSIELEGEIFNEVIALKALQAEIKELEKKADEKKMLIQKRMGKASEATFNGVRVCTWKGYEVSRVNTSSLRQDFPEIYDELVEKTYQRRFMLK
jgi:predicted phage-related endonuclease